jgi:hypothetical protein
MFTPPRSSRPRLPREFAWSIQRAGERPGRFLLSASVATQSLSLFERAPGPADGARFPAFAFRKLYRVSTSAFGIGQAMNSNRTPLGLHRIAEKIGAGHPIGTVFEERQAVGLTWQGRADATIVHRILWLEGLEPGYNRGGNVDTRRRYIYLHGFGDEMTLGRPQSHGCIHLAAADLMPLFDLLPTGTLVWIAER